MCRNFGKYTVSYMVSEPELDAIQLEYSTHVDQIMDGSA